MSLLSGNRAVIEKRFTEKPFKFTIDTTKGDALNQFQLPFTSDSFNCFVDKGDGSPLINITTFNQAETLLTWSSGTLHTVSITGLCPNFRFQDAGDKLKLITVDKFGSVGMKAESGMFFGCSNTTMIKANDWIIPLGGNLLQFAANCSVLTLIECADWDVSDIEIFESFAINCTLLPTIPVSNWDTSSATTFRSFCIDSGMTSLDVSGWSMSNVTDLRTFATRTAIVILDVSGWDVSNVTLLDSFIQSNGSLTTLDTTSWDTDAITSCSFMVLNCGALTSNFTASKWWTRTIPIPTHSSTFSGAVNVPEFPVIPASWGGGGA